MTDTLIKRVNMDCPICGRHHKVEEKERSAKIVIKDEKVTYKERFYFCENAKEDENEFASGAMANKNLLNAKNAYRIKKGLLTSNEIIQIREDYGLSQVDLAKLLGWGEATISRYETKAIQDEAYDTMLRLIRDNPQQALELLNKNQSKFSDTKIREIREKIIDKINIYGKEYLTRETFKSEYVNYSEPSDFNGFTLLNIDKIEAAISYIAEDVKNLFKVKLMKMLWYVDALSYKNYGYSMTGLVYIHSKMGALPIGHYSLMNLENLNVQEEESANYANMLHIYPTKGMNYDVLNKNDKLVLDKVIHKFKNYTKKDIVDYMHKEKAYIETATNDIILFSLAKEIIDF